MSAYMLWLGEVREQIKQEHPGISVTELSKVAGEKWKQIEDKSVSWHASFAYVVSDAMFNVKVTTGVITKRCVTA